MTNDTKQTPQKESHLPDLPQTSTSPWYQSLFVRILLIILLGLLMLIPLTITKHIVADRNTHYENALQDVAQAWGGTQTILGPILVLPYVDHFINVETVTNSEGETNTVSKDIFNDRIAIFLPKDLTVKADIKEEQKQQGIYDSLIYNANVTLSGEFDHSRLLQENSERRRLKWKQARIVVGLSDTKAINKLTQLSWGEKQVAFEPGTLMTDFIEHGIHAPLRGTNNIEDTQTFSLRLSFKGSTGLHFTPLGKITNAHITSTWLHPSFKGDLLPDTHVINEQGFDAKWEIPHLARNYPQMWTMEEEKYDITNLTTGVNLFEPVSLYSQIEQAIQYGIYIIGLTFLVFIIFELVTKEQIHYAQYILIGLSLSVFYLILVALAEQLQFMMAYLIAAATSILLLAGYTWFTSRNIWRTSIILLLLTSLYGVLYLILQMEDYALIAGASLSLVIILSMMYATTTTYISKNNDLKE